MLVIVVVTSPADDVPLYRSIRQQAFARISRQREKWKLEETKQKKHFEKQRREGQERAKRMAQRLAEQQQRKRRTMAAREAVRLTLPQHRIMLLDHTGAKEKAGGTFRCGGR